MLTCAIAGIYLVREVIVTNRGDCCGERLNDFTVLVGTDVCASNVQIQEGETKTVRCWGAGARGSSVKITLPGSSATLSLCEVRVKGTREAGACIAQ